MKRKSEFETELAEALRRMRSEWLDETQKQFAERFNAYISLTSSGEAKIDQSRLSRLEKAQRTISLDYFKCAAECVGLKVWQLLFLLELQEFLEEQSGPILGITRTKTKELIELRDLVEFHASTSTGLLFRNLARQKSNETRNRNVSILREPGSDVGRRREEQLSLDL